MQFIEIKSDAQKRAEDQIRRGITIRADMKYVTECSWGYGLNEHPIVQFTSLKSGNWLVVELLDPNPDYEECGEPLQTIWIIDLTAGEFDLIDEIEAISDHMIDHQVRFEEQVYGDDLPTVQYPSRLYREVVEIALEWGLNCETVGPVISTWSWKGAVALTIHHSGARVMVEFESWVMDFMIEESGCSYACPIFYVADNGDMDVLIDHMIWGLADPEDELEEECVTV